MKLPRRKFLYLAAGAAALPAFSRMAWAQAYPSRRIRLSPLLIRSAPFPSFRQFLSWWVKPWA
jgi:hypothetical protein